MESQQHTMEEDREGKEESKGGGPKMSFCQTVSAKSLVALGSSAEQGH